MENASKALIIAGAILLSILIIGLGMTVLNSVGDVTDVDLSPQEAAAFNDPFISYIGEKTSGKDVRSLIEAVKNHNGTLDADSEEFVYIDGKNALTDLDDIKKTIKVSNTYETKVTTYRGSCIQYIEISAVSGSGSGSTTP